VTQTIFTIGHSTHPFDEFLQLLAKSKISVVADLRSRPFSRFSPQFNQELLTEGLRSADIGYVFLGRELGARTDDRSCYVHGKVQYDRLARTPLFRQGLDRLRSGIPKYRIAIMCAEKDPVTCHRMILVCRELKCQPLGIQHIRPDGSLESNEEAERRLMQSLSLPEHDLFTSRDEMIEKAYQLQGDRIAWTESQTNDSIDVPAASDTEVLQ
jgi:uncharacterized protein (DUF488 family)